MARTCSTVSPSRLWVFGLQSHLLASVWRNSVLQVDLPCRLTGAKLQGSSPWSRDIRVSPGAFYLHSVISPVSAKLPRRVSFVLLSFPFCFCRRAAVILCLCYPHQYTSSVVYLFHRL